MTIHFEEIWEQAEQLNKSNLLNSNVKSIIDEIKLKLDLYNNLDNLDIDKIELNKLKTIAYGEVLFSLTKLSLLDNINVAAGLNFINKK